MFNLSFSELLILSVLALIFIGPKQLPELARVLGRLLNELKRASGELTSTFTDIKKQTTEVAHHTENQINKHLIEEVYHSPTTSENHSNNQSSKENLSNTENSSEVIKNRTE